MDSKEKEKSPLALALPQLEHGESSQGLQREWKFVSNILIDKSKSTNE